MAAGFIRGDMFSPGPLGKLKERRPTDTLREREIEPKL
jgi:hypothetical protein